MNILGIETSCDETAAAVVKNGRYIISNIVSSQIKIHKKYGGIVPELASRHHLENINFVIEQALKIVSHGRHRKGSKSNPPEADVYSLPDSRQAGVISVAKRKKIDAVSVTAGPGLIGSLLIGTTTAQTISKILNIPVIGINHIEGHIFANYLQTQARTSVNPPFISLIVSGGHTDLILVKKPGQYKVLGRTRDDAVGEVFDKIAKFLNLGYPGGPVIDKLAKKGNTRSIVFPRPYMWDTFDFSFSGLKTAVINYVNQIPNPKSPARGEARSPRFAGEAGQKRQIPNICASFQQACVDVLVKKTIFACRKYGIKKIILGGGVSSNSRLRAEFREKAAAENIKLFLPEAALCTDNAAMIASAGYFKIKKAGGDKKNINPSANLELTNW